MKDHIEYIIDAHEHHAKKPKKALRYWDMKTPYFIHPLWCATTISTETELDETTRKEGALTLLYHDVVEDTTKPLPDTLSDRVKELVGHMTFEGGSAEEMEKIWEKPIEVKLYKLYDKVSNLLDGAWMKPEKKAKYVAYTKKLCEEVESTYGDLHIVKMAKKLF